MDARGSRSGSGGSLSQLALPPVSPSRKSMSHDHGVYGSLPSLTVQMSDRTLWLFVVVGLIVTAISLYIFVNAETNAADNKNAIIGSLGPTLNIFDSVPVVTIVGILAIISSCYAFYRAYKSYEGTTEISVKQGGVMLLFLLNMFLTAAWFNSFYVTAVTADSDGTQTPTAIALGLALTSGILVSFFWNTDRICAGLAAFNCVTALVGAWASYKLRQYAIA